MKRIFLTYLILAPLAIWLAGCESEPSVSVGPRPTKNVLDIIQENGYTDFIRAVDRAGLRTQIENATAQTIFAPTNDAFNLLYQQLGVNGIDDIDAATLAAVLRYHISTDGEYLSSTLPRKLITLAGNPLYVTAGSPKSLNSKSLLVLENRSGTNGTFHGINLVLSAPSASIMDQINALADAASPQFSLLRHALVRAGLDDDLDTGDFTLFAPTNTAFTNAGLGTTDIIDGVPVETLTTILKYHVLTSAVFSVDLTTARIGTANGTPAADNNIKGVDVNAATPAVETATIQTVNNLATNGTWHQVSAVIRPKVAIKEGITVPGVNIGPISAGAGNLAIDVQADAFGALVTTSGYTKLDGFNRTATYGVYFPRSPLTPADFADNEAIVKYIERHIFPASVNITTTANGTKVTSIGEDEYYVATGLVGSNTVRYINGLSSSVNTFVAIGFPADNGARRTVYDGFVYSWGGTGFAGLSPLPATTITDMLAADADFELFSAALKITGKDDTLATGNRTLFAITDATFAAATGIADPAVILGLDESDEDDAALIEALAEVIDAHTVNSVNFGIHLNTFRPALTGALENELFFGVIDGNTVIIQNKNNPQSNFVSFTSTNQFIAKNGVVHVVDKIFSF